ncbi:MAG: DUF2723 domain-containing protein [Candidatus Promineifilaceae bacterium]
MSHHSPWRFLPLILIIIPLLYLATLAQGLVLGDPTEYTMIAQILGIAHPPGYAFITVLGKLFQTVIPLGDIPWRMHLLSAAAGTLAAACLYGIVKTIGSQPDSELYSPSQWLYALAAALFAAFSLAFSADWWQHAIHANPHIWTAVFLAFNLYCLTQWATAIRRQGDMATNDPSLTVSPLRSFAPAPFWLFLFSFTAGLGITHHPLTLFSFPAYALFIVWTRPRLLLDWRTLLKMVTFALLGLALWLYFPLRSPSVPFGPTSMNTLNGFLDHVLARGLSESLPYFRLVDLPDRLTVFWSLLRLQYPLPTIFLALIGLGWLWRDGTTRRGNAANPNRQTSLLSLYGLAFLANITFVMSLKAQDIMAYLLGPFMLVALLAGIGLYGLVMLAQARLRLDNRALALLIGLVILLGPVAQILRNGPRVTLRRYDEGDAYVTAVFDWFGGKGEGVTLLNDWEHQTPLWYHEYALGETPNPADVRPRLVAAARPWVESVFDFLGGGPVYLSNYRREVVDAGFRLRPRGPFYQVVEPGDTTLPPELTYVTTDAAADNPINLVGYELPHTNVTAGDYVPLTLALSVPVTTTDYYAPVVTVGAMTFAFTTDSHLITPRWQAGEIIIERFDFALPHNLPTGTYPLTVRLQNLSQNQDAGILLNLGGLQVAEQVNPRRTAHLLANFRQSVGLVAAVAQADSRGRAPWPTPLTAHPGDVIHLTLTWECLAPAAESYTIFVHLIRPDNSPVTLLQPLDYTPLGGSAPTHLWIPKWLPGQQYTDPYRMELPPDLPPGTYQIEVGLYEMVSGRRLHISDAQGNLAGDRAILGAVEIIP